MQATKPIFAAVTIAALTACGSSSDGGGTVISKQQLLEKLSTGVYRFVLEIDLDGFSQDTMLVGDPTVYTTSFGGSFRRLGLVAINDMAVGGTTVDACDLDGPEVQEPTEIVVDSNNLGPFGCSPTFLEDSTDELRVDYDCSGLLQALPDFSARLSRLSTSTDFNYGNHDIDFALSNNLDAASTAACGTITTDSSTQTTLPSNPLEFDDIVDNESEYTVVIPYLNSRLELELNFATASVSPGVFTVVADPTTPTEVSIELDSDEFGPPGSYSGASGTVTITAAGARSISGSYDVSLVEVQDVITGTFSLTLQ